MRLIWLVGLMVCVVGCGGGEPTPASSAASPEIVSFLHLNDTYRIDAVEDGTKGGFGRVTTVIRQLQDQGRTVHLLHGGDFLYPSLESQLWDGQQMIEAFNFMHALAPLIVVPGNHEFDRRTPETLIDALEASDFPWLAANIDLTTGRSDVDQRIGKRHTFVAGGKRFGVFSLTLHPDGGGNVRDYMRFAPNYLDVARQQIEELEAEGVDLIVGLTHLHLEDDLEIARLRADYPRFVLVAGGHEHEPEHSASSADRAEVVKGASNARTIWQIDFAFDQDGGGGYVMESKIIELDESVAEDPEYQVLANQWRSRLLETIPFLPSRVGQAAVPFDAREVTIRNEESNWGNFVVDQMRVAFGEPAADLAFINSGTLRIDDYIAGDITFEDIARTFGFSSLLRYLEMNGEEFKTTLEAGFRGEGPSKGYFPQVSGFRVCVDRARVDGDRIVQLQVPTDDGGFREIDAATDYLVVAPDYLLRGGDGYQFPDYRERSRAGSELKYLVLDAVVRAQAEGRQVGAPVDPENPRIAFLADGESACF